jgi:hypothetical protein
MVVVTPPDTALGNAELPSETESAYAVAALRLRKAATGIAVMAIATAVVVVLAVEIYSPFRGPVLVVAGGFAVVTGVAAVIVFVATARHMIHVPPPSRTKSVQQRQQVRGTLHGGPAVMVMVVIIVMVASGLLLVTFGAMGLPRYVMGGPTARATVTVTDTHVSCYKRCVNVIESTYVTSSGTVRTRVVGSPQAGTTVIYSVRDPRQAMTVAAYDAAPGNLGAALMGAAVAILAAVWLVMSRRRATTISEVRPGQPILSIDYRSPQSRSTLGSLLRRRTPSPPGRQ